MMLYGTSVGFLPQCLVEGCVGLAIPNYGPYNPVGFVFVIMGPVQIVASVYISLTHSPTPHAVANSRETYRTR